MTKAKKKVASVGKSSTNLPLIHVQGYQKPISGVGRKMKDEIIRRRKSRFIAFLMNNGGMIKYACDSAGISMATYYYWRDTDEHFYEACVEAISRSIDEVENVLYKMAMAGNLEAIKFYLTNKRPRKWNNKVQITTDEDQYADLVNSMSLDELEAEEETIRLQIEERGGLPDYLEDAEIVPDYKLEKESKRNSK